MASKKSKLKKRKQAQQRQINQKRPKEKHILDHQYIKINKKGDLVFKNDYLFKKDKHSGVRYIDMTEDVIQQLPKKQQQKINLIRTKYDTISERMFEWNEEHYPKNSVEYNELVDILNDENKQLKRITERKIEFNKLKNKEQNKSYKSSTNNEEVIKIQRLRGGSGIFNTISTDEKVKEISNLLDCEFNLVRDMIFPTFDEDTGYMEMQNIIDNNINDFETYVEDKYNKGDINKRTKNKIYSLFEDVINV